jgi:hypothetical protein
VKTSEAMIEINLADKEKPDLILKMTIQSLTLK